MKTIQQILLPKTRSGRWAVGLIIVFIVFILAFFMLVKSGQRGGQTFFSNPLLAITILIAGFSGSAAFFTGLFGIIRKKEKSVLVFLATMAGLLVFLWMSTELLFTH